MLGSAVTERVPGGSIRGRRKRTRVGASSDQVLPAIANRWRVGDRIELLYLPEREYDSAIISTG